MSSFSINGTVLDKEHATISVLDRGILYGDGIFEGIRMYNRAVFKLDEHLDRLYESAKFIDLVLNIPKDQFRQEVLDTARACSYDSAYVRITVSRSGSLGLHTTSDLDINRTIIATPLVYQTMEAYEKGLHLVNISRIRIPDTALPMRAKTLNYLNNILAVNEAKKLGAHDALLLNSDGYVAESSGSNIFFVKDNTLVTPAIESGILVGVTRNCILQLAQQMGLNTKERLFTQDELESADEVFLTGTAMEIMPVYKINNISIGEPGKITKALMKSYKEHILKVPGYSVVKGD